MNLALILQYLQLKFVWFESLNDENISASILLLQKVEEIRVGYFSSLLNPYKKGLHKKKHMAVGFSSEQVALKFSDAVVQLEHPVSRN